MSISLVWWETLHQPDKPIPCCVNGGPFSWGYAPLPSGVPHAKIMQNPCWLLTASVDCCLDCELQHWTLLHEKPQAKQSALGPPFQYSTTMDTTTDGIRPCYKALGNFFCSTPASLNIKDNFKTFNDLNLASEEKHSKWCIYKGFVCNTWYNAQKNISSSVFSWPLRIRN